ncbi:MAG TPA: cell division protein FtsZ [Bacteroidales bacterium]|nr:cell division protein FtsZ [Bacteroidales bacterium]HPT02757.1 cell division protein FtsZ [Bacteroidales bacterium]
MLKFDLPKEQANIIKVIGVGGGGSNAVTHMFKQGIKGVDFLICNTDAQALAQSPVPNKIQLGSNGLGAGSRPEVGREAAIQKADEIRDMFSCNTSMLFITAGMGGGTGTGAAPVIAQVARELGILTVGIVTKPFAFEGRKRDQYADAGIEELKKFVDTILVICNDKLLDLQGDLKLSQAFGKADDVLTIAARGIAEIITVTGRINVDFEDVKTVMLKSGKAIMGAGIAEGPNRAIDAVQMALNSPLLDDTDIKGADNILLYITSGKNELSLEELNEITNFITDQAGEDANLIWGDSIDEALDDEISITLIATGFDKRDRIVHNIDGSEQYKSVMNLPVNKPAAIQEVTLVPKDKVPAEPVETPQRIAVATPELTVSLFENPAMAGKPEDIIPENAEQPEPLFKVAPPVIKEPELVITNTCQVNNPVKKEEAQKNQPELENIQYDRISKLKEMSMHLKRPGTIEELERQPAYIRRNVELTDMSSSQGSIQSRYTIGMNDNQQPNSLKENNSFLHDNVD